MADVQPAEVPGHSTAWAESGTAGVECDSSPHTGWFSLDVGESLPCPHCGATVRLVWDVRVETVQPNTHAGPS